MKSYHYLSLFIILFFSKTALSQNTKHSVSSAKIEYQISLTNDKELSKPPMEYTLFIKNDMSRVEMNGGKAKIVMISDNLANLGYMLMDNSGSKIAMKMNREMELKKKGISKEPKVEITRESKMIAGYPCFKAIITSETDKGIKTYDVWFTNEIKGNYSYETKINGLNGLMMEFENVNEGKTYKMTATKVDLEDNLSDDLFKVPSDYQIMDMSNFQGGMQRH